MKSEKKAIGDKQADKVTNRYCLLIVVEILAAAIAGSLLNYYFFDGDTGYATFGGFVGVYLYFLIFWCTDALRKLSGIIQAILIAAGAVVLPYIVYIDFPETPLIEYVLVVGPLGAFVVSVVLVVIAFILDDSSTPLINNLINGTGDAFNAAAAKYR